MWLATWDEEGTTSLNAETGGGKTMLEGAGGAAGVARETTTGAEEVVKAVAGVITRGAVTLRRGSR